MSYAQRRVLAGVLALMVVVAIALGLSSLTGGEKSGDDSRSAEDILNDMTTAIAPCVSEFGQDVAYVLDNPGGSNDFLLKYGLNSDRYKEGIRMIGPIKQDQIQNGTEHATDLLSQRVTDFCMRELGAKRTGNTIAPSTYTPDNERQSTPTVAYDDRGENPYSHDEPTDTTERPTTTTTPKTPTTRAATTTTERATTTTKPFGYEDCINEYQEQADISDLPIEEWCERHGYEPGT